MSQSFNIGDRVRRTRFPHGTMPVGYEANVIEIKGNGQTIKVRSTDGEARWYEVQYFELVMPAAAPAAPAVQFVTAPTPVVPQVTITLRQDANGVSIIATGSGTAQTIASIENGEMHLPYLASVPASILGLKRQPSGEITTRYI